MTNPFDPIVGTMEYRSDPGAKPTVPGLYATEIHFGWKLLEWHDGAWWHMAKVGRWMADDPVQWVGPLPECKGQKGTKTPEQVFDL